MRRAATELVDRAVSVALDAFTSDSAERSGPSSVSPSIIDFTSDSAERSLIVLDSAERSLTTEMLGDTLMWPAEQVITQLSEAAQSQLPDLQWQQLTGEKVVSSTTGGALSIANAFQSGPETESYMCVPSGMTGRLARAEQQPLAGFSCGGAHDIASASLDVEEPTHDLAITDSELGTCIGMCAHRALR